MVDMAAFPLLHCPGAEDYGPAPVLPHSVACYVVTLTPYPACAFAHPTWQMDRSWVNRRITAFFLVFGFFRQNPKQIRFQE